MISCNWVMPHLVILQLTAAAGHSSAKLQSLTSPATLMLASRMLPVFLSSTLQVALPAVQQHTRHAAGTGRIRDVTKKPRSA